MDYDMILRDGLPLAVPRSSSLIGEVRPFAGWSLPFGWAWCNGSTVSSRLSGGNPDLAFALGSFTFGYNLVTTNGSDSVNLDWTSPIGIVSGPAIGDVIPVTNLTNFGGLTISGNYPGLTYAPLWVVAGSGGTGTFKVSLTKGGTPLVATVTNAGGVDNVGTFLPVVNLPDLRGRVIAGRDNLGGSSASRLTNAAAGFGVSANNLLAAGGSESHTLALTEIPAHTHTVGGGQNTVQRTNSGANTAGIGGGSTGSAGSGGAHANVQPTQVMNFIIRTT